MPLDPEQRYLKHKPTGSIYIWTEFWANRDDVEEFIYVEPEVEEKPSRKKKPAVAEVEPDAPPAQESTDAVV